MRLHILISVALLGLSVPAAAFDAGSHWETTTQGLYDVGFRDFAIKTCRYENWLVDYYSANPIAPIKALEYLHFDNLPTTQHCRAYWGYLTNNTRRAMENAARANDTFSALCLLGMSLHAVQDFYTHSNWPETHLPAAGEYRTDTWWSNTPAPGNTSVFTGLYPNPANPTPAQTLIYHGSYFWGVNHDNMNRPNWENAYVFGYCATVEWALAVRTWVERIRPGFFNQMKNYKDPLLVKRLDQDMRYEAYLSMWAYDYTGKTDTDGRWKAYGSGSIAWFGPLGALFAADPDDKFILQFKPPIDLYKQLLPNLSDIKPGAAPAVIPAIEPLRKVRFNRRAIIVRGVSMSDDTLLGIDFPFPASYYALLRIAGIPFVETCRRKVASGPVDWWSIRLVPKTRDPVPVFIAVYNDNHTSLDVLLFGTGPDLHADINPAAAKQNLSFTFSPASHACAGDVSGVGDTAATAFSSSGAHGNKGTIKFYVTEKILKE